MGFLKGILVPLGIGICAALAILIPIFISASKEGKKFYSAFDHDHYILRLPRFTFGIGVACSTLFTALVILMFFIDDQGSMPWGILIFGGFALLGVYLIIVAATWKIEIQNNDIAVYKPFGLKDITKVVEKGSAITLYAGERKICKASSGCDGFPILLERLKSEGIPFEQRER